MQKLTAIEVHGFRGQSKTIKLLLKPNANFLIGRNGTGKTTLIKLINGALSADVSILKLIKFTKLECKFESGPVGITPTVTITRTNDEVGEQITYTVSAVDGFERKVYPLLRTGQRPRTQSGLLRAGSSHMPTRSLKAHLAVIYRTTWLSLQRGVEGSELNEWDDDDEEGATGVDQRLRQVVNDLVKYFSRLDRRVADETQTFQKRWFLSFLSNKSSVSQDVLDSIKLDDEKSALSSIFENFAMSADSYEDQLEEHFALAKEARVRYRSGRAKGFGVRDMLIVSDTVRLHTLVEQWQQLQDTSGKTYQPRTDFIEVLSEMFFRKDVLINPSNQVVVQTDDGEPLDMDLLSSGEKQLMIFLSETLLQEQESFIFLADEPELSLHVEWQEELVPNLLKINPNAQVIFATHSPDVVNRYQSNVFKMEELIN